MYFYTRRCQSTEPHSADDQSRCRLDFALGVCDMALRRPDLWIFVDWDETVTSHDTLSLVAPPDSSEPGSPPPFSFFSKYYMEIMDEHEKAFGPRETLERQLEYLDSLGSVEKASVSKVEEYGLFKGVKEADIRERGKQVKFRDGWKNFTDEATRQEHVWLMGVLSVNWSKSFIVSALRMVHDDAFMEQFEIRANVFVILVLLNNLGY
jgi:hypothetical protein